MRTLEKRVIEIFARQMLLVNVKLSADDAENTVKLSTMITVAMPFMVALGLTVAVFSNMFTTESIKSYVVIAVIVIVFGVSGVTDRIYDRNTQDIRTHADEIKLNPEQGAAWVRRRLFKFYGICAITMIVPVVLIQWAG